MMTKTDIRPDRLVRIWPEIVDTIDCPQALELAKGANPASYRDGKLILKSDNPKFADSKYFLLDCLRKTPTFAELEMILSR